MQIFVKKADLAGTTVQATVSLPDSPWVERTAYGPEHTVLSLPMGSVIMKDGFMQLVANWRSNASMIVRMEAQRRILECFSEFMQRNANMMMNYNTLTYGANPAAWPANEKARFDASIVGVNYVEQVRLKSDQLEGSMPTDPTDDAHWPARIPPVYI